MTNPESSINGALPPTGQNDDTLLREFVNCIFVIVVAVAAGLVAFQIFGRDLLICSLVITAFILLGYIKVAPKSASVDFGTAPFVSSWRWTVFLPLFAIACVFRGS